MVLDAWHMFTTVVTDSVVALVLFIIFNQLRLWSFTSKFFAPRRFHDSGGDRELHPGYKPAYRQPPPPPSNFFALVDSLFSISEETLLQTSGPDAVVYIRLMNLGLEVCIVLTVVNCALCLPFNLAGPVVEEVLASNASNAAGAQDVEVSDLDKTSMANVAASSNAMFAHTGAMWITSVYMLWRLWRSHADAVTLRLRYLINTKRGAASHTVLVTDVPGIMAGTYPKRVLEVASGPLGWIIPKGARDRAAASVTKLASHARSTVATMARTVSKSVSPPASPTKSGTSKIGTSYETFDGEQIGDSSGEEAQYNVLAPEEVTDMDPWVLARARRESGGVQAIVEREFDGVYPGQVTAVFAVPDQTTVQPKLAAYERTALQLEDLVDQYMGKLHKRKYSDKKHRRTKMLLMLSEPEWSREKYSKLAEGKRRIQVDLLEYLIAKHEAEFQALMETSKAVIEADTYIASAFVTLRSRALQTAAARAQHHHIQGCWKVQGAPSPSEVVWDNLRWRDWERNLRTILAWTVFVLIMLFYLVPVTAIQTYINLLPDTLPGLFDIPVLGGIMLGVLPTLALTLLVCIMPAILTQIRRFQGLVSLSGIEIGTTNFYFIFQFVVVFVYTFVTGTTTSNAQAYLDIDQTSQAYTDILGSGIPQQGTFFMSYVLLRGTMMAALQALRVPNLAIYWARVSIASTKRARARLWQHQPMQYPVFVVNHTIALVLALVYAQIQPLMLGIASLYFVVNSVTWRYNMVYVYSEQYQSGGRMWPSLCGHLMAGLLTAQLVLITYMGIKLFAWASLLAPLPVITVYVWWRMSQESKRRMEELSMRAAADLDQLDMRDGLDKEGQARELRALMGGMKDAPDAKTLARVSALCSPGVCMSDAEVAELRDLYQSPCFRPCAAEHKELQQAAADCVGYMQGKPMPARAQSPAPLPALGAEQFKDV